MAAKYPTPPACKVTLGLSFANEHFKCMRQLREKNELIDFYLKVGDKTLPVHKTMMTMSPVLKAMLISELSMPQKTEATFDDFEPAIFEKVIDYMYSGEIEVEYDDVEHVIMICDYLQLEVLKNECASYVIGNLNITNCIGWFRFADKYRMENAMKVSQTIIKKKFFEVQNQDEFKELSLSEVLDIVKHEDMKVISQGAVLEVCLNWVNYREEDRAKHVPTIVNSIRLEDLPVRGLKYVLRNYENLIAKHQDTECKIMKAFMKMSDWYSEVSMVPRNSNLYIGGGESKKIWRRDMSQPDSELKEVCSIPAYDVFKRSGMCATKTDILFIGGGLGNYTNRCEQYTLSLNKWKDMSPMSTPRCMSGCVRLNDKVYSIAGSNDYYLNVVECLDLKTMCWQKLGNIPQFGNYAVNAIGNIIFCFGWQSTSTCHKFDTDSNVWSSINKPETIKTGAATSVTAEGLIYILGGSGNTCACYNPDRDTWKTLSQPKHTHTNPCAVHYENELYLLGGESSVVEMYDIERDAWSVCSWKLPESMKYHQAFLLDE